MAFGPGLTHSSTTKCNQPSPCLQVMFVKALHHHVVTGQASLQPGGCCGQAGVLTNQTITCHFAQLFNAILPVCQLHASITQLQLHVPCLQHSSTRSGRSKTSPGGRRTSTQTPSSGWLGFGGFIRRMGWGPGSCSMPSLAPCRWLLHAGGAVLLSARHAQRHPHTARPTPYCRYMSEVYLDDLVAKGPRCFDHELYISAAPAEFEG